MNHRLALLVALLVCPVAACTPTLSDAFYTCEDGICPDGFFCAPDKLCHEAPLAMYADCASNEQCASGDCDPGFDDMNDSPAQCTMECSNDAACPDVGDAQGRCAGGQCVVGCQQDVDCPEGVPCLVIPMTMGVKACIHLVNPDYGSVLPCSNPGPPCPDGLLCLINATHGTLGVCTWPCGNPSDACPFDAECLALTGATAPVACLAACNIDIECREGLKCLAYPDPSGTKHCVPPLWP